MTEMACWFCETCQTMTLLAKAEVGECARKPAREDCPAACNSAEWDWADYDGDDHHSFYH